MQCEEDKACLCTIAIIDSNYNSDVDNIRELRQQIGVLFIAHRHVKQVSIFSDKESMFASRWCGVMAARIVVVANLEAPIQSGFDVRIRSSIAVLSCSNKILVPAPPNHFFVYSTFWLSIKHRLLTWRALRQTRL